MIIKLAGYHILDRVCESTNSLVYRGIEKRKNRPVILKFLKQDYPSREELTRYKQEYEITRNLNIDNAIVAHDLETFQNTLVIIFDDFGGCSLDLILKKRRFTIKEFLEIAIKITAGLKGIHASNIIHKDINPSNIVYNSATQELKIIDFGIATFLSKENPKLKNPNVLEGTLFYISPEQTGRINSTVDCRSDFYSLGATFYELLTNKRPFLKEDLLELLYCHLAIMPVAPDRIEPKIPSVLSDIIMKLMAKNPDERYQSAWGIQKDLENCQQQLADKGKIVTFELASQDISDRLQISQKLYGRENEITSLLTAFERVCDRENPTNKIVLVFGYSGIGKTRLVRELYRSITKVKGYFITGKFDQYQRNIPYSAIGQALSELVEYLLVETETVLQQWREKISAVLGDNAAIIIDIIPKLELIIGKQPEVPKLPAKEAENRFNILFEKFVKIFCQKEHPLAIFLDDLQWIDSASLKFIQLITAGADTEYLFLIGAYRDNEVNAVHPLMLAVDEIEKAGVNVDRISLLPLNLSHITNLIVDSFNCTLERAKPLANLVLAKTKGNPFFVNEFFRSLYRENLLYFDYQAWIWKWNLEEIRAKNITENVVELLSLKIQKLEQQTQQILKLAACMGDRFEIKTLAIVAGNTEQQTALLLREAMTMGLVYPLSDAYKSIELEVPQQKDELVEYKFSHDRIQQAAYSLIPDPEKQSTHLKIGQLLLKHINLAEKDEKIFTIINQLNIGIELIQAEKERYQLARLNAIAGKKARDSSAFAAAFHYFSVGLELLGLNCWNTDYDLTFTLHTATAETAYLNGNFDLQVELVEVVLQKARSVLEKVEAYKIQILALAAQNQVLETIETALQVLRLLGFNFPNKPSKLRILLVLLGSELTLLGKESENIINLALMKDPHKLAVMEILASIGPSVANGLPELGVLLSVKGVNLSLRYGNTSISAFAYACYGSFLCGLLGDINNGYRFGQLALNLLEKFNNKQFKARTIFTVNNFINHWKKHIRSGLKPLLESYSISLEVGDLEFAGYSTFMYCYHAYFAGKELGRLSQQMSDYIRLVSRLKQKRPLNSLKIYHQVVLNLLGQAENPCNLNGESLDEELMLAQLIETNHQTSIFDLYCNKLILCYLFKDFDRALLNAALAKNYLQGVRATPKMPVLYFYYSLAGLAKYSTATRSERKNILRLVNANQRKMKKWAHYAPMNYLHKYYLVAAEKARLLGDKCLASEYFDRAIALAKENEFIQEEALANELAGKFYLAAKKDIIAEVYLKDSCYCYQKWGAKAKVKAFKQQYPQLSDRESQIMTKKVTDTSGTTSNKITSEELDLATLIKISQALSRETKLDKLLEIMLKFTVENVGAQTGLLILDKGEEIFLEAQVKSAADNPIILSDIELTNSDRFPISLVRYVQITRENIVLKNASYEGIFTKDNYIAKHQIKSILCLPLLARGKLIGVIYLENNLTIGAFNAERLEILKLISSQAAISLENALLKNKENHLGDRYQVGGCLTPNSPSYVIRQADRDLYNALKRGDFCYVFNARQMGKSSLRIQIMNQLSSEGFTCVAVDLSTIGSKNIAIDKWYASFIYKLASNLQLLNKFNFRSWWQEFDFLASGEKLREFIEQIVLPEISQQIVIFIDEIDSILGLNFPTDDFFALLRYFYNYRAEDPKYQRLHFVLLGVATPSHLIQDSNLTPFNIGVAIPLENFKIQEINPLVAGLTSVRANARSLVENVLEWTGGQPFLTQKICRLIVNSNPNIALGKEAEFVEQLVRDRVIHNWQFKDDPEHLKTISNRLLKDKTSKIFLLKLYRKVLKQKEITFNITPEIQELLLSGLVSVRKEKIRVSNRIYEAVFNSDWIELNLD